ncbi:hypothetical protein Ddye_020415 [Dipteronia dyeriana]|uniref:Transposase n=1 Tax=Dipteronia dyeriana TaxID=168575 RepID=A0AAD9U0R7_9ROSI|nr:hypothetical protein Ddye_020415 [Dipteronia dyeriana]
MYGVPPKVANHGDIVGPQLDKDFSCQIEMSDGQYNHQYNEMYNDMNNERNNELNVGTIHEVANELNLHLVDNVANNEKDKEPFQMERRARRVHRCSSIAIDIVGTSKVRPIVTSADSEKAITWVIPGAESYAFGMVGSRNLVEDEPTSMIYKRQFFPTKKDLKRLVGHFAIRHNFEWKVKKSNKIMLHLVCLMDNCTWKLRAVRRDEATYFQVRSFVNEHTCPLEEIHYCYQQASAVIIGKVVAPRFQHQDGRLMRPKDIISDMKTMYENNLSREWFLDCLKGALDHIDDLVFISDRHASIELGISKVFPYTTHTICVWHFSENIKKRYQRKEVATIMDKAARAYIELQYNRHMEELRNLHPNVYDYVIDVCPHKWSRVHCPNRMYIVITINAAKCINLCLKFARQLPMLTLAEFIRNMLHHWFHDRNRDAQSIRHQFTDAAHHVILKRVDKCNFMTVNPVD